MGVEWGCLLALLWYATKRHLPAPPISYHHHRRLSREFVQTYTTKTIAGEVKGNSGQTVKGTVVAASSDKCLQMAGGGAQNAGPLPPCL